MAFCNNCGKSVGVTDKFCKSCGTQLTNEGAPFDSTNAQTDAKQPTPDTLKRGKEHNKNAGLYFVIGMIGVVFVLIGVSQIPRYNNDQLNSDSHSLRATPTEPRY